MLQFILACSPSKRALSVFNKYDTVHVKLRLIHSQLTAVGAIKILLVSWTRNFLRFLDSKGEINADKI